MLIKTYGYITAAILTGFFVFLFVYSIINKKPAIRGKIVLFTLLTGLWLIIDLIMLGNLNLDIGMELLIYYFFSAIAGFLGLISVFINIFKNRKAAQEEKNRKVKPAIWQIVLLVLVFIVPEAFLFGRIVRDKAVLAKSDLVVLLHSSGNGWIGDRNSFGFAVKGDSCKSFDYYVNYGMEDILGESAEKITCRYNSFENEVYKVFADTSSVSIYYKDELIYKYEARNHSPFLGDYFNISLDKCFIRK
ncbi:MAG: hypothetical protein K6B75_02145 [Lachnospiraceae bacterium]|nr:hypothetical protein [Lachnospiraceae bacterium]